MKSTRKVALAASGVVLALTCASAIPAGAVTPGVGTAKASTTFLDLNLGDLLHVGVVNDHGEANIDPKVGTPVASSGLDPLVITSKVIPALNITIPGFKTSTSGAQQTTTAPSVPLSAPLGVLGGNMNPLSLSSVVNDTGALSGITAGLKNFNLINGLVSIPNVALNLGANALKANAVGVRGIDVSRIDALNLAGLLRGLGIDLTKLPLNLVTGLLDNLHLQVPLAGNLLSGAGVLSLLNGSGSVTGLLSQITALLPAPASQLVDTGLLNSLTGTLGLGGASGLTSILNGVTAGTTPVSSLLSTLQGTLNTLLGTVMNLLDRPLLSLNGLQFGLNAKATDAIGTSVADVVAKIGSISVAGITLPGLDVGQVLTTVNGVLDTVTSTLNGVLAPLGLGNLLDLGILKPTKSITQDSGYIHALAGLSALHLGVNVPAALSNILGVLNVGGLGSILGILGNQGGQTGLTSVPGFAPASDPLNQATAAASPLGALAKGVSLDLVKVQAASDFATVTPPSVGTPAPVGELPMTGENHLIFVFGLLFLATGAAVAFGVKASRNKA